MLQELRELTAVWIDLQGTSDFDRPSADLFLSVISPFFLQPVSGQTTDEQASLFVF